MEKREKEQTKQKKTEELNIVSIWYSENILRILQYFLPCLHLIWYIREIFCMSKNEQANNFSHPRIRWRVLSFVTLLVFKIYIFFLLHFTFNNTDGGVRLFFIIFFGFFFFDEIAFETITIADEWMLCVFLIVALLAEYCYFFFFWSFFYLLLHNKTKWKDWRRGIKCKVLQVGKEFWKQYFYLDFVGLIICSINTCISVCSSYSSA